MFFMPLLLTGTLFLPMGFGSTITGNQMYVQPLLPMLIYFNSDDCSTCAEFDALFEQAEILQRMEKKYVPVRVSIDDLEGKVCADIYDVTTVPAFVVADQKGIILYKSDASLTVKEIQSLLDALPGQYADVKPIAETASIHKDMTKESTTTVATETTALRVSDSREQNSDKAVIPDDNNSAQENTPKVVQVSSIQNAEQTKTHPHLNQDSQAIDQVTNNHGSTETPQKRPVAEKPVAKKINAVTASRSTSVNKATARTYAIQLGYFSEAANANKLEKSAVQKGLSETRTQKEMHNGIAYFRVLIGNCNSLSEAQKILDRVHSLGLKGAVYRQ